MPPPVHVVAAALAQRLVSRGSAPITPVRRAASAALAVGSLGMLGGSATGFRSCGTTVDPLHPDRATALVTTGPQALTRNPMYVGMAGLLAAHAVARGSWIAALPVAAFVAVMDRSQIPAEEAALRKRFGEEYRAYCARVPRWLPHP